MDESTAKEIFTFTSIAFFPFGIMWVTIGPLLSSFSEKNNATLAAIGGITAPFSLGRSPRSCAWARSRTVSAACVC